MNTAVPNTSDRRIGVLIREGRTVYYATLSSRHAKRRALAGMQRVGRRHDSNSLSQANGRGSVGKCPASGHLKTPAERVHLSRAAVVLDGADTSAHTTATAAAEGGGA